MTEAAPTTAAQFAVPNQYHLYGGGLTVSYFPLGFGPVHPGGQGRLIYQDAYHSLNFNGSQIRKVDVPDGLGTVVTVTIVTTVDTGDTTFSLLIPNIQLPERPNSSAPINTVGITTIHRTFLGAVGVAQRETYTVTPLAGTAVWGMLPL